MTSQNVKTKIAKILHNIHWEKQQQVLDAMRDRVDLNVALIENGDTDDEKVGTEYKMSISSR